MGEGSVKQEALIADSVLIAVSPGARFVSPPAVQ